MAQKIEFIVSPNLQGLKEGFNRIIAEFGDVKFIVTPISFSYVGDEYVLAVRVEATHKRVFPDSAEEREEREERGIKAQGGS